MEPEVKKKILEELGNLPEEMYDELVGDYRVLMKEKLGELQALFDVKDYDELSNLAHFIKGASVNLRLSGPRESAQLLEQNAKKRTDLEYLQPLIDTLKQEILHLDTL
jgi:HPt (histidine-containing phosphotransfer) domain-containing protein